MTPEELRDLVRINRRRVLPFVGAGLALDAGAPSVPRLVAFLAERFGLDDDHERDLTRVTKQLERTVGREAVQFALAERFAALRMRPTPALLALVAGPARTIVTTNYDDAIEVAVRRWGGDPVTLLPGDRSILDTPEVGTVHVIHVHGIPDVPGSLVLPGKHISELAAASDFTTFLTTTLTRHHVLYLGFGFAATEHHLREIVAWIDAMVADPLPQWLLLGASRIAERKADLEFFESTDTVQIVGYDDAADHKAVEHVATAMAPRWYDRATDEDTEQRLTWVQPIMVTQRHGEPETSLEIRVNGYDVAPGPIDGIATPVSLAEHERVVVVAGPGMGKSKFVRWMPHLLELEGSERRCATGRLAGLRPDADPERAILRLLTDAGDAPVRLEDWQDGDLFVLLDGLDELGLDERVAAVRAIAAAADARPRHRFLITSRPVPEVRALEGHGFTFVHIAASRRWARRYLETRGLTARQVDEALLREYELGDVLRIPLLAEMLADRLLDGTGEPVEALALVVSALVEAVEREAGRSGVRAAVLEGWLRQLAVGLQLRGRSTVPLSELAEQDPQDLTIVEGCERLTHAGLLGDVPGQAGFLQRPLQEALMADAIVRADDPVAAFRFAAVAEVEGRERLRADFGFVADLVFEHASRADRERLRMLDPLRWARTVLTRGTAEDAASALELIETAVAEAGAGFAFMRDGSSLRSTLGAVLGIGARWPEVIAPRRDTLLADLRTPNRPRRSRALTLLSTLAPDEQTETWLLPLLDDDDPTIVHEAARVAARVAFDAARPRLLALLSSANRLVAATAAAVLVDRLAPEQLPDLADHVPDAEALRHASERLAERLDLDTGLRLVEQLGRLTYTSAWLLDRLVESVRPLAWTEERVRTLTRICAATGGSGEPDLQAVARAVAQQLPAAVDTVHLWRGADDAWHAARPQLAVFVHVPAEKLALLTLPEGFEQVLAAAREEADEQARRDAAPAERRRTTINALDDYGADVDLSLLDVTVLRTLDERHKQLVAEAVARTWPRDIERAAIVGAEVRAPLPPDRWAELLRLHAPSPMTFDIGSDRITDWLSRVRPETAAEEIAGAIHQATQDLELRRLLAIGPRDPALAEAAVARLRELGPEWRGWLTAVGFLIDRHGPSAGRALLDLVDGPARVRLLKDLAESGDADAYLELITAAIRDPERRNAVPQRLRRPLHSTPALVEALTALADALATDADATETFASTVQMLGELGGIDALRALETLASRRLPATHQLARLAADVAARCATAAILASLPAGVVEAGERFSKAAVAEPSA